MARNVCVDGTFLDRRYFGTGVHSYSVNVLRSLERVSTGRQPVRVRVLLKSLDDVGGAGLVSREGFELYPCAMMREHPLPWRVGMFMIEARRLKHDALFLTFPTNITLKALPLAVTVHDIIPLHTPPDGTITNVIFRHAYKSSLRRADLVFTDSEFSKQDMVSALKIRPEKIVVAYLGFDSERFTPTPIDSAEREDVLKRYGIAQPYILSVGNMDPRKNPIRLVQAYRALLNRRKDFDLQLVLCGKLDQGYPELVRLVRGPDIERRVILTGPVPDPDLAVLYRSAACFAMSSLYEGFGLPLLEAMASGVPAISSKRSSLPEVGGDAVLYFDPECVEDIAGTLERVLNDSTLQKQLVERGLERAKQFSWEKCARTTLAALRAL